MRIRNELAETKLKVRIEKSGNSLRMNDLIDFYFNELLDEKEIFRFNKWIFEIKFTEKCDILRLWNLEYRSKLKFQKSILNHLPEGTELDDEIYKISEKLLISFGKCSPKIQRFKIWIKKLENFDNLESAWEKYNNIAENKIPGFSWIYNPTCVAARYNISFDDAVKKVEDYKVRKATNLKGFITRHGEEEGRKKFKKFQETSSSYTRKVVEGIDDPNSTFYKSDFFKKKSPRCSEYYISKGISNDPDEINELISQHQKNNSGVHKQFYLNRGFTEEQAQIILDDINSRKGRTLKQLVDMYSENEAVKRHISRIEKYRSTVRLPLSKYDDFYSYRNEVYLFTKISIDLYNNKIENIKLRGRENDYQLDHIFSIYDGYKFSIDPAVIGHWTNLRCIPTKDNLVKGIKSEKTQEKLFLDFYKEEFNEGNKD